MEVNHKQTYREHAVEYERMVAKEDFQGNLLPAIEKICPLKSRRVLDLGTGTGRVTRLVAPKVNSVVALDISLPMLQVANNGLSGLGIENYLTAMGDHREIPLGTRTVDLVISGWSICYLVDWYRTSWQLELKKAFLEMKRVLEPGGKVILIETQGTGFENPQPPEHLIHYFRYLECIGFSYRWIRTDYRFADLQEAKDLAGAFFGEDMREKITANHWVVLPECTGVWWYSGDNLRV